MAKALEIGFNPVFEPLLEPSRYKGAWGGRGSGKSHFFAELMIANALRYPGSRMVCIREVQKTLRESSKRLLEDKLISMNLGEEQGFVVWADSIQTPGAGIITFQGMQDASSENIKSLEGFRIAWVEEAQTLSERSLTLLRPTIRMPGSELWFSWNARRKSDPVDMLLRNDIPTSTVVVKSNWRDNPLFPAVLEQERQDCLRLAPEQYDHIWEGGYVQVLKGAYFAQALAQVRLDGRIGHVAADPLLPVKLACDIGGTGARSDAFTIWAFQTVGREVRFLDYYEAVGQDLGSHLTWLRTRRYTPDRAGIILPHDGAAHDKVYAVSYESAFRQAGYEVIVVPNQGRGAAAGRIEVARRIFPACWFNEPTTKPGIEALGWYHEQIDETRQLGMGPAHDWSSHGADSFGLACIVAEDSFNLGQWRSGAIDYRQVDRQWQ